LFVLAAAERLVVSYTQDEPRNHDLFDDDERWPEPPTDAADTDEARAAFYELLSRERLTMQLADPALVGFVRGNIRYYTVL